MARKERQTAETQTLLNPHAVPRKPRTELYSVECGEEVIYFKYFLKYYLQTKIALSSNFCGFTIRSEFPLPKNVLRIYFLNFKVKFLITTTYPCGGEGNRTPKPSFLGRVSNLGTRIGKNSCIDVYHTE